MKSALVSLIGDPIENLYLLGKKEEKSFKILEERALKLLSSNTVLRFGHDIISRAKIMMKKKKGESSFFDECIESYASGLGIDSNRYMNFISLFELAARYGQIYPELKGILPGCTSLFEKGPDGVTHTRLLDFPLLNIFDATPRLYFWQSEGRPSILNYSCEGLAPIFFQAVHSSGFSLSLHHKPGENYTPEGESIFKISFETLFEAKSFAGFKRDVKKRASITKWGFLLLDKSGQVFTMDLDGTGNSSVNYDLEETNPLIFTNIPLQIETEEHETYLRFCLDRQNWLKAKLARKRQGHILDLITDVDDQKVRGWMHPAATLSTVGAYHINLTHGTVDLKDGVGAQVGSDGIVQYSLADKSETKIIKEFKECSPFEMAWKRAASAQSYYDQRKLDLAYHELQMAEALMPHPHWREILKFYLLLWDFMTVSNKRELALIYKKVLKLSVPDLLKDQWLMLCMRLEKKLNLAFTVKTLDLSPHMRPLFEKEISASKAVFLTWMKLLYPRIELLDVFSPHHKEKKV